MARRTFSDSTEDSVLSGAHTIGATALTLLADPGSNMETTGPQTLHIDHGEAGYERVTLESRTGTAVTLDAGTPLAANHADGAAVYAAPAKADMDALMQQEDITAHAAASDPHGDRAFATAADATHSADTTGVHGITDTSKLAVLDAASNNFTGIGGFDGLVANTLVAVSASITSLSVEKFAISINQIRAVDDSFVDGIAAAQNRASGWTGALAATFDAAAQPATLPRRYYNGTTGEEIEVLTTNSSGIATMTRAVNGVSAGITSGDYLYPVWYGNYPYQMLSTSSSYIGVAPPPDPTVGGTGAVTQVDILLPDPTVDPYDGSYDGKLINERASANPITLTEPTTGFSQTNDVAYGILPWFFDLSSGHYCEAPNY